MNPDIPMRHSPYTPLGRSNLKAQDNEARVLQQVPVLAEALKWLEEQIAYYDSKSSVPKEVLLDTEKFMHLTAGHQIGVEVAKKIYAYLQSQIKAVELPLERVEEPQGA